MKVRLRYPRKKLVRPRMAHRKSRVAWIPTFPIKIHNLSVWGAWALRVCKRELQGFHFRALVVHFPFVHLNDLIEMQKKNPKLPQKSLHPSVSWKRHLKHLFSLRLWQLTQDVWKHHSLAKLISYWSRLPVKVGMRGQFISKPTMLTTTTCLFFSNCLYFQTNVPVVEFLIFGHQD